MTVATEQDQVVGALRHAERLLLTTHENPDGDALGSLLAMQLMLEQLGKDSLMYVSPDEFPLPWEYRNWTFDRLVEHRRTTWTTARSCSSTAGTSTACRWTSSSARGCGSSTSTITTTTRASAA